MSENKKNIEIVDGDGSNLDISHVYDHLNSGKPKCDEEKPKNIIIPKSNKDIKKKQKLETVSIFDFLALLWYNYINI